MGGLDSAAELKVNELIKKSQDDCPRANENAKEIEHLKEAQERQECINKDLYDKVSKQNEAQSKCQLDTNTKMGNMNTAHSKDISEIYKIGFVQLLAMITTIIILIINMMITSKAKETQIVHVPAPAETSTPVIK